MTGFRVRRLLWAVALGTLVMPAAAQWVDPKPPVLEPGDYPPEATQDAPDKPVAKPTAKPAPGTNPAAEKDSDGLADSEPDHPATGAPQSLAPDQAPAEPQTGESSYVPPKAQPAPVEVGALGSPEGPPVGTLDASNGGLGEHLWSGSDRGKVEALMTRAPIVSGDPVLRDLVRRAVLTRAAPPPGQAKKAFNTTRIERLLDAGMVHAAGALAAQAAVPNDDEFARVQAEAILLANRTQDACGPATGARLNGADVFWMQLRVYCAQVAGDTAAAELTRQVLKVQGHDDPAYDTLVEDVLTHKPLPPGAVTAPTAMHVFLYQQAGLPLPEAVGRKMGTAANVLVMRDARNPPRARFEAAERIVTSGAASPEELVKVADAQDLPLGKVANAAAEAPNVPFFMGQVLLRRAAMIEPRAEDKAHLARLALSLGEKFRMAPIAAALQADVIASIKPSPALRDHARDFARALVLAGRSEAAASWAGGDAAMKVLVALASNNPQRIAATQADLSAFAAGLAKNPPDPGADRASMALTLGLLDVTGYPMPPDAKAASAAAESGMWDGERPGPGQMRTIVEIAGSPERRGEAVLMLTGTIGAIGLKTLAPDVTVEFVRLLMEMNETAAARALAIEALAEYAPPPQAPALAPQASSR